MLTPPLPHSFAGLHLASLPLPPPPTPLIPRHTPKYKKDYFELVQIIVFFALYLTVVMMKSDPTSAFQMRQKIVDSIFGQTFDGETSTIDTDSGFVPRTLDSQSNVYLWLGGLVEGIYVDPICGDGKCKGESQGWNPGPFVKEGCPADCKKYSYTMPVEVTISGIVGVRT